MHAFTKLMSATAIAASLAVTAAPAHALTNLVQNGSFELTTLTQNSQFGAGFGTQGVTNWVGGNGAPATDLQFWFDGGTQTTVNALNQFGDPKAFFYPSFNSLSADGGDFVALDGDQGDGIHPGAQGAVSQDISGLQVGKTYTLTFDWAAAELRNRTGPISEQLQVSFGSQTFLTSILNVPSMGFSGWQNGVTLHFTPTATTQTLKFLSIGTPHGLPPIAVLDGVSLTVPEPATWAMLLIGFGGIGAMIRRRRQVLATA